MTEDKAMLYLLLKIELLIHQQLKVAFRLSRLNYFSRKRLSLLLKLSLR